MKTGQLKSSNSSNYCVYILRCKDATLYIGITNNINKRVSAHNNGTGAKYTRGRTPVQCVYIETDLTKSEALKREHELKRFNKIQKEILISMEEKHGSIEDNI